MPTGATGYSRRVREWGSPGPWKVRVDKLERGAGGMV